MRSTFVRAALSLVMAALCAGLWGAAHAAPTADRFSGGTKVVGVDIAPGTYRTRVATEGCYWERLSGFDGSLDAIIANQFSNSYEVVTIAPGDAGFNSDGCGDWSADLSAITSDPSAPFGDGVYIVGTDIAPGTWRAAGGDDCYWERTAGFGGTLDEIIANDFTSGSAVVTIAASDAGFRTSGCGSWTRLR